MFQELKDELKDFFSKKAKIDRSFELKRQELMRKNDLFRQELNRREKESEERLRQLDAQLKRNCENIKQPEDKRKDR